MAARARAATRAFGSRLIGTSWSTSGAPAADADGAVMADLTRRREEARRGERKSGPGKTTCADNKTNSDELAQTLSNRVHCSVTDLALHSFEIVAKGSRCRGAAKRLLKSKRNDRQVASFNIEWLVVKKRFQPLFSADEIKKAKDRIARYEKLLV